MIEVAVVSFYEKVRVFIAEVFVNTELWAVIHLHVIHQAQALLPLNRVPRLTSLSLLSWSSSWMNCGACALTECSASGSKHREF